MSEQAKKLIEMLNPSTTFRIYPDGTIVDESEVHSCKMMSAMFNAYRRETIPTVLFKHIEKACVEDNNNYMIMLKPGEMVEVTEGMVDVDETVTEITVKEALVKLNNFNIGKYHPDVYVIAKYKGKKVFELIERGSEDITHLSIA